MGWIWSRLHARYIVRPYGDVVSAATFESGGFENNTAVRESDSIRSCRSMLPPMISIACENWWPQLSSRARCGACSMQARTGSKRSASPIGCSSSACQFGRKFERLDPEQLQLARGSRDGGGCRGCRTRQDGANRRSREEAEDNRGSAAGASSTRAYYACSDSTACPCCHGVMHVIGEETANASTRSPRSTGDSLHTGRNTAAGPWPLQSHLRGRARLPPPAAPPAWTT